MEVMVNVPPGANVFSFGDWCIVFELGGRSLSVSSFLKEKVYLDQNLTSRCYSVMRESDLERA